MKYDVIVSEPSNPWVSGVAGLFSIEFYKLIARQLNHGGILVQWLQLYDIDVPLVASVLKALSPHFSDFHIYAANDADILIVARVNGDVPSPDATLFKNHTRFATELQRVGIGSIRDVEIRKIADKRLLTPWLTSLPVSRNSDYYPNLDLDAERARFLASNARALLFLREAPLPMLEMMGVAVNDEAITAITPTRRLKFSQSAFGATRLRDHILERATSNVPPDGAAVDREITTALDRCTSNPARINDSSILFKVGFEMVPYLRLVDPDGFWKKFNALPCAMSLRAEENDWLDLFKAVANRDAHAMGRMAEKLLTGSLTGKQKEYLLAVGMLAHRVQANTFEISELSSKRLTKNSASGWSLLLDLLGSNSNHQ